MIRVAILARSDVQARTLADLLAEEDRFEIVDVRAFSNALTPAWASPVDVVVGIRLPADQIPADGPPLVLLMDGPTPEDALGRGVRAWLPLSAPVAEIAAAIVAAANELSVLTQDQVKRWLRSPVGRAETGTFVEPLTPRELQVLRMLAGGLGNKEIAGQLGISEHTAKFHVAQILAKLGAASRTEAVTIGIRRGMVPV